MSSETEEIIQALTTLSNRVSTTVADARLEGLLRTTEYSYSRYIVTNGALEECEYGVKRKTWDLEHFTKESWFQAMRIISWRTKASEEYCVAARLLSKSALSSKGNYADRILDIFNERVAYNFSETTEETERDQFLRTQLEIIQRHLEDEVFLYSSEIRLVGVVAPATPIEFKAGDTQVNFRRVTPTDLVDERSEFFNRDTFPRDPSAILNLSMPAISGGDVQRKVWQAITILRLFRVGSVRSLSYSTESDSFFSMGGILTNHDHHSLHKTAVIANADAGRFEQFWRRISNILPSQGYEHRTENVDPIDIAYQRYADSLLTWGASVERRIADAVMGLESLLLRREENQELAYRLRMRIARILSVLGSDPYAAKKVANDAYTVRSAFVHGAKVNDDDRKAIIKRHGSFEFLLDALLDQLRVTIVVMTVMQTAKEELIKDIDDSFIDSLALPRLKVALSPAQELAGTVVDSLAVMP